MLHKQTRYLAIMLLALALVVAGKSQAEALPAFTGLVQDNTPAVVNISSTQSRERGTGGQQPDLPEDHPFREFFEHFGGPEGGPERGPFDGQSRGSGFIISDDGYILTNYHVVENADEIIVRLSDRREYVAEIVGSDERSDLALLRIEADDLPTVQIGSSSDLEVGEWVLAIGSPFGFEHSATAGIVSAVQRSLPQDNYVPFIQTDVAINPGNSGGPLFNLDGEVVGINSHIYSRTGGFMGLSFAIPIELAMDVVEQLQTTGRVARGWLGVMIQDVNRDLAESFGMDRPQGALVAEVVRGSPAEDAGFEVGDVILRFDGQDVTTSAALPPMVGRQAVDSEVEVDIVRQGESKTITLTLGELPEEMQARAEPEAEEPEPEPQEERIEELGIELRTLESDEREALDLDRGGVLIDSIDSGVAAEAGLRQNDVITMLNQEQVESVEQFREVLADVPRGSSVPVLVYRDGSPRFFAFRLPAEEG